MKYCNLDGTKSVTVRGVEGVKSARARAVLATMRESNVTPHLQHAVHRVTYWCNSVTLRLTLCKKVISRNTQAPKPAQPKTHACLLILCERVGVL
jgi:hypothetical protein